MFDQETALGATGPFDPVARIARTDVVEASADEDCAALAGRIAEAPPEAPAVACVLDGAGRFAGLLTLRDCLRAPSGAAAGEVMDRDAPRIASDRVAGEAARSVLDGRLEALPVVDPGGRLAGIVSARTAHRYLLGKVEDDANDFAGLVGGPEDDYLGLSLWGDFRRRAPWVLSLAVAGLAAGYVVHRYEDALDALVILALYMPMVADTGGNVGTQAASLVTRAIGYGGVSLSDAARILWREARVSLMMASMLFLFAYLKVLLISNPADVPDGLTLNAIALAIGVALAVQVVSATLIGAILPVAAAAARQDPAVVSGPALTTIVDLTGLIIYFGLTTHFLGLHLVGGG